MHRFSFAPIVLLAINTTVCAQHAKQINRDAMKHLHGEILFTVSSRQNSETYAMKPDGTNQRRLIAAERGKRDWFPRWSSGGKKIVFFADRNGEDCNSPYSLHCARFVMNSDGSSVARFSPDSVRFAKAQKAANHKSLVPLEPDLSPDGTQIVFSHGQRNDADEWHSDLFLINTDGSNLRKIHGTEQSYQARWSPDGRSIVFDSTRDGGDWDIYLMSADGSNLRRLTSNAAVDARPVWSADGRQIAFHSNQHGGRKLEIYVMDADGSNQEQLTNHQHPENVRGAVHPDWYVRPHVFNRPGF